MLRTLVLVSALLLAGVAIAAPASAEAVTAGSCEVDACVYACVHVTEACPGDTDACVLFAFRLWCI